MERVTGIGGVFVKARDPAALQRWYRDHLGVEAPPSAYGDPSWWQEAGPTVLAAMTADAEHFGPAGGSWSLNFRVRDLDAMVAQLRAAAVAVEVDPETYPDGRFASLLDAEGNAVQLWQPDGADLRGPQDPPSSAQEG